VRLGSPVSSSWWAMCSICRVASFCALISVKVIAKPVSATLTFFTSRKRSAIMISSAPPSSSSHALSTSVSSQPQFRPECWGSFCNNSTKKCRPAPSRLSRSCTLNKAQKKLLR
tara:strand:- start:124249 stop:124590 length:342 start_codon:yes stop_codon:yes gene_type:complete